MPLIIHASRDFAKRYRCQMSLPGEKVPQPGRPGSWSAHFVRIGRKPVALMMHDATLCTVIIPATGVTTLPKFLNIFLARVAGIWAAHGATFDPANQQVLFFPRSNRPLIGSMNEVIFQMRIAEEDARRGGEPFTWGEIEAHFNDMPFGAMKYARPKDMMAELLKGDA